MTMRMLDQGGLPVFTDGVREADHSNPGGYYELERVKELDKGGTPLWLGDARGKAVKIISLLLTHLPESYDYQVVFVRRDLDEIIASQNKMLDARGEAQGAEDSRLKALYVEHLAQVERFLSRRSCFSTLMLEYSNLVGNPAQEAARLNTFLGGRLDATKMAAVADRALYRNRAPSSR
jgi:hypothetical protein